jgi:sulfofructose kinase
VIAVTLGNLGAVVMVADGSVYASPAYEVDVVDTTGAGDTFHGAFLYGLLAGWSVERTLDFSNAAAALCCTELGARGGARSLEDVLALMREGVRRVGRVGPAECDEGA